MQYTQAAGCSRQVCWLPLSSITPRIDHAFGQEESRSLQELTASIQRYGLQTPITVRPLGEGRYGIVSGNRRFLACRMAGYTHLDAIVLPEAGPDVTERELLLRLTQGQMHYLEEADACRRLVEEGMTREQLARCLGRTPTLVSQKLRLTELDEELRAFLIEQALPEGYARALSRLPDAQGRLAIARQAVAQRLCIRDVELLVTAAMARLPVPPPTGGRTISLMRDHRLYLNAIQAIIAQMEEAGIAPEVKQTRFGDYVELTLRIPVRRPRMPRARRSAVRERNMPLCPPPEEGRRPFG